MNMADQKTYTALYDKYPSRVENVSWVQGTVDRVTSMFFESNKIRVREDAKYFLLINFSEMIVLPARERFERERLEHDLGHDLRILLDWIAFRNREKREISGHDIIDALSKNWSELDVMRADFWG